MRLLLRIFVLIISIQPALCQEYYPQNYGPENGYITRLVQSNDTLFGAGNFYIAGFNTGSLIGFSGIERTSIDADLPFIDSGELNDIVADGNGGWYVAIAGGVNYEGNSYRGVVHFNADKSLDENFTLTQSGSSFAGTVNSLKLNNNILYVGGSFESYNGIARPYLLAYNLSSNQIIESFNAGFVPASPSAVRKLEVYQNKLFVGGDFLASSGQPANNFGVFDLTTGELLHDFNTNADVKQLAFDADTLFAGGAFSIFDGSSRLGMAKVNLSTNTLLPFNASFDGFAGRVWDFKFSGASLFVCGQFSTVNGFTKSGLVKMNRYSGEIDAGFQVTFDNPNIQSMDLQGDQLLFGGNFNQVNGFAKEKLAQVNQFTGELSPWESSVNGTPVYIKNIAGRILIYGNMDQMKREIKHGFFALKLPERYLLPLGFSLGDFGISLRDMAKLGNKLYFASSGGQINGISVGKLFSFDLLTQEITSIGDFGGIPNATVDRLLIHEGKLYVHGYFLEVNGLPRSRLARINLSDNTLDDWNPTLGGSTGARSMLMLNSKLYLAGIIYFNETAYALGSLNLNDGSWAGGFLSQPSIEQDFNATDLISDGTTLYLSGDHYLNFNPLVRSSIIKLDEQLELDQNFVAPMVENANGAGSLGMINGVVFCMQRVDSENRKLYFHSPITGDSLLSLDITFNGSTPFIENLNLPYSYVFSDNFLFIGGNWNTVNGNAVRGLAVIDGRATSFPQLTTSLQQEMQHSQGAWNIFPNPNDGQFTIKMERKQMPTQTLEVFDISGRMVFKKALSSNLEHETINLNFLTPGSYLVRLNSDVKRVLIQSKY